MKIIRKFPFFKICYDILVKNILFLNAILGNGREKKRKKKYRESMEEFVSFHIVSKLEYIVFHDTNLIVKSFHVPSREKCNTLDLQQQF